MAIDVKIIDALVDGLRPTGLIRLIKISRLGPILFFGRRDIVKVYRPRPYRAFGTRLLGGEIGFFVSPYTEDLRDQSRIPVPQTLIMYPTQNYPVIVRASTIADGRVSDEMIRLLALHLDRIPATSDEIRENFGADYFDREEWQRGRILVDHLRSIS